MVEDVDPSLARPFRDIPWSVMIALVLNLVAGVWFASGLEQRVLRVETRQIEQAADIGRLDRAREDANVHMTKLDDQFRSVDDKLGAILTILQQDQSAPPSEPSGVAAPPQNFQKPPARR